MRDPVAAAVVAEGGFKLLPRLPLVTVGVGTGSRLARGAPVVLPFAAAAADEEEDEEEDFALRAR